MQPYIYLTVVLVLSIGLAKAQNTEVVEYLQFSDSTCSQPPDLVGLPPPASQSYGQSACLSAKCISDPDIPGTYSYYACLSDPTSTIGSPILPKGITYVVQTWHNSTTCNSALSALAVIATGACISNPPDYYKATCAGQTPSFTNCSDSACTKCETAIVGSQCIPSSPYTESYSCMVGTSDMLATPPGGATVNSLSVSSSSIAPSSSSTHGTPSSASSLSAGKFVVFLTISWGFFFA